MNRTIELTNMSAPDGTLITFQGNEVGRVIRKTEKGMLVEVDSDIVRSWIESMNCGFNVEVVRK